MIFRDLPDSAMRAVRVFKDFASSGELSGSSFFEFIFSACGAQIKTGEDGFSIPAGSLCVIPPDTQYIMTAGDCCLYRIQLLPKSLEMFLAQSDNSPFTRFLIDATVTGSRAGLLSFRFSGGEPEASVTALLESMYEESRHANLYSDAILMHEMSVLLYRMLRDESGVSLLLPPGISEQPEYSERHRNAAIIYRYLLQNYASASLKGLADLLNYSLSYCSQYVLRNTGMTFKQLQKKIRMQEAVCCLLHTDMKIGKIAEHVGYSSGENFMKQFKEEYGITPTEYRKQAGSSAILK